MIFKHLFAKVYKVKNNNNSSSWQPFKTNQTCWVLLPKKAALDYKLYS